MNALTARQPPGLEAVVLLAPSLPSPEPMSDDSRQMLRDGWGRPQAARDELEQITVRALPGAVRARTLEDNALASQAAWQAWPNTGSREDLTASMPQVEVPTTTVAGAGDAGMSAQMLAREVVARLANARLQIIENVGHLLPLEAPDEVADIIRNAAR